MELAHRPCLEKSDARVVAVRSLRDLVLLSRGWCLAQEHIASVDEGPGGVLP